MLKNLRDQQIVSWELTPQRKHSLALSHMKKGEGISLNPLNSQILTRVPWSTSSMPCLFLFYFPPPPLPATPTWPLYWCWGQSCSVNLDRCISLYVGCICFIFVFLKNYVWSLFWNTCELFVISMVLLGLLSGVGSELSLGIIISSSWDRPFCGLHIHSGHCESSGFLVWLMGLDFIPSPGWTHLQSCQVILWPGQVPFCFVFADEFLFNNVWGFLEPSLCFPTHWYFVW